MDLHDVERPTPFTGSQCLLAANPALRGARQVLLFAFPLLASSLSVACLSLAFWRETLCATAMQNNILIQMEVSTLERLTRRLLEMA